MEVPNLSYINELSGGDESFKNKLIAIIKTEFPEEKEAYFKNFEAKDFKATAENVHKLKHKISILGLEKSYKVAGSYEDNLNDNNASGYEAFNDILKTITDYLETL
ncbi:Hpt domain-containing protein [uncultured Algibacter sp.]|jgi:HPt (histidine-containing phosphotransfer) domain-containing protein|uniref:Hpt domain-containing protein n=1 Tax=uncultured Algibacter sp. TaxID=298659 RepID=UPI00262C579C|nr:Hpt domain-containing protein [uncultured Algibacter sp.]